MHRNRLAFLSGGILLLILVGAFCAGAFDWFGRNDPAPPVVPEPPRFVGREACQGCHPEPAESWSGSHHDLAMQEAREETVLGDFSGSTFTRGGVTSEFFRREGKYFVRTDGPNGELEDYEVRYTFGVTPLQQYLIEFPGGRVQVLGICWDSRPREKGGQRWFHIYPDEIIDHEDPLHWTGRYQNWNFMCAECHSTNLERNYNLEKNTYATTWSEINVSCEACHGPGSLHVRWAEAVARGEKPVGGEKRGLVVTLKDGAPASWEFTDPEKGTAKRVPPRTAHAQVEACSRCHSRRSQVRPEYVHGRPLLDTHRIRVLEDPLYYSDGQIRDEVYVYGSFLQSRMYHQGVTCSDCHDPHSLRVADGNAPCLRCHLPTKFDTREHHFHRKDGPGGSCLDCHMPSRKYMVVDPRRDHSIRIPRPDLSVKLGTPNACNQCHTDQTAPWAAAAVEKWYGEKKETAPHFGEVLHAGRTGDPGALKGLIRLSGDATQPGIARASALLLLRSYPGQASRVTIAGALADPDPLVRSAALNALEIIPPENRLSLAFGLLEDPLRSVRADAVRALAPVSRPLLSFEQNMAFNRAYREAVDSELVNAERPEAHLALGVLYTRRGHHQANPSQLRSLLAPRCRSIVRIRRAQQRRLLERLGEKLDTYR